MNNEMYECRVWLFDEDDERLARLMDRLGYSKSAVIREALKVYEMKLDLRDIIVTGVEE